MTIKLVGDLGTDKPHIQVTFFLLLKVKYLFYQMAISNQKCVTADLDIGGSEFNFDP